MDRRALPGRVWSLGLKRTVGSWGLRGEAEILPVSEQREQRSGYMSKPGAKCELTKGSNGREKGGGSGNGERWNSGGDGDIRIGSISEHEVGAGTQSSTVSRGHIELVSRQTSRLQAVDKKISCKGWEECHDSFSSWQVVPVGASLSCDHHPEQRNQGLGCWRVSRG